MVDIEGTSRRTLAGAPDGLVTEPRVRGTRQLEWHPRPHRQRTARAVARSDARGRFGPSPTGDLPRLRGGHLIAWLLARSVGASFVLRVEDIDTPRVVRGMVERQLDDLRWLGLDWDEGPDVGGPFAPYALVGALPELYEEALADLARGLTYLCDCSRAEGRARVAPHVGEEPLPGPVPRVRHARARVGSVARGAAARTDDDAVITVHDRFRARSCGTSRAVGDFVLKRGDGVYSYQLAVVVDDLAMHRRGRARGRPARLGAASGAARASSRWNAAELRAPLVLARRCIGSRSAAAMPIRNRRDAREERRVARGVELAWLLGLIDAEAGEITPRELLACFDPSRLVGVRAVRLPA